MMKHIIRLFFCVVALSLTCCLSSFQDSSSVQNTESSAGSASDSIAKPNNEYISSSNDANTTNNNTLIVVSMVVALLLIIAAIGFLYTKYADLQSKYSKLLRKVDDLNKQPRNMQTPSADKCGNKTRDPKIEELDRRVQTLEQNLPMAASFSASKMIEPVAQTAKLVNHGYFKEPIKGQSGAYFEELYHEKSGACFEVEHTGDSATFNPIIEHSALIENDRIILYAVDCDGDLNNSHSYKCTAKGMAHLVNGRWIIDTKAKVKLN